jgi:hypothetical protein
MLMRKPCRRGGLLHKTFRLALSTAKSREADGDHQRYLSALLILPQDTHPHHNQARGALLLPQQTQEETSTRRYYLSPACPSSTELLLLTCRAPNSPSLTRRKHNSPDHEPRGPARNSQNTGLRIPLAITNGHSTSSVERGRCPRLCGYHHSRELTGFITNGDSRSACTDSHC